MDMFVAAGRELGFLVDRGICRFCIERRVLEKCHFGDTCGCLAPQPSFSRLKEVQVMLTGSCHCGAIGWMFDGMPESVTACNCTLCRRYGVLWIYDYEGERISVTGPRTVYTRHDRANPVLEIQFCSRCGCVACWRGLKVDAEGRRRMAVNLRLAEPGAVAHLPIDHFDGLATFDDLPRDERCVADMWF